jgi:hypothetical protein
LQKRETINLAVSVTSGRQIQGKSGDEAGAGDRGNGAMVMVATENRKLSFPKLCPVRPRVPGDVGTGREKPPATR